MAGHPPKLVLRYFTRFCELLNDISAAKGHHNMDPSKLLRREYINTACFYPGDELDNSKDQPENQHINDIDIFHAKRTELLQCLEIVSILVAWPQNVAVIRNTAGKKFIMYFMACAKAFREKLDFLIHQTFSEVQTLQDLLLVREENLLFTMEVHLHLLHFLAHSTSTPSSEFYDFLPCQPWTSEEIYHLTQESMMHMTIASNGEGFEKTFLSSSVQKNVVLEAVKRDLLVEIVEQGHFSHLVNLWKSLQVFKTIPKHGITGNELAIMERKTDLYTVIMEAEVLDVMSNVYASAPELIPSRLSLDFPIRQVFEASVQDLISSTCTVDALITRIKLLCLRINSSIMAVNHQGNLKVMDGSLTPKDISKVLIWFHEKFHKYETDMDWIEKCLTSCSDFVTIQFGSVVGTIDKSHDLWPWHHDIGSGLDDENTTVATDFHLLPKTTLTKLSTEVKKQPAYVLWDALVCEVMGTQSLSNIRPPISGKAKVGKSRIHYTFQIFHEVFRHKMYQEATVPSSSMRAPLPFGQLKFVDFISQIFRAAEASEIFQILEEFETFRLLLSDKFLCSFGIQISMVAETYTQASIEYIEGKQVVLKLLGVKNDLLASLPVWLLLQNGIVDYFHGLAIYSMYFQSTSVQDVVSYLGYEDILLVLTQQVMALCRGNKYPHVVYQMTRLIINLNDIAQSMGVASRKDSRNKIISYVLEVVEISCRTRATVAPENKIDIENCMLFAGLSAATELLLHLISPATSIGFDWLEVFLQDDQFRTIDLSFEFQKTGVHRRRNVASTSSTLSSSSSSKITSRLTMAVDKSPMDNRNDDTKDRGCRLRNSIASLLTLLLDENLYRAAVYITQCLIVACAEETVAIDKEQLHFSQGSHHDSGRKRKQAIRSLAADAMNQLLAFAAVSHKHSNLRFSILVVNDAMNSIIFLLRDARYQHLRLAIQEFIRRENILYEILRSFARCLNGFDIMKTKLEGVALEEMDKFTADIIRTTLTLITATVSGNDACKNILSLLLQANREKVGSSRLKSSVTSMDGKSKNVSSKTASGLTSLILCGEKSPSHDTIVVILDLILDGPFGGSSFQNNGANAKAVLFSHDEDRPKIKNFAILPDFFLLIPHCQEQVQWFAIESFKNLVCGRASLVNLNVCSTSRPKVIDIALDLFPYLPDRIQSSNSELVELLGRHSVSVASLKHLFRVLQQKDGLRVPYSWKIIQVSYHLHVNAKK